MKIHWDRIVGMVFATIGGIAIERHSPTFLIFVFGALAGLYIGIVEKKK